jgi:hypothetical protein
VYVWWWWCRARSVVFGESRVRSREVPEKPLGVKKKKKPATDFSAPISRDPRNAAPPGQVKLPTCFRPFFFKESSGSRFFCSVTERWAIPGSSGTRKRWSPRQRVGLITTNKGLNHNNRIRNMCVHASGARKGVSRDFHDSRRGEDSDEKKVIFFALLQREDHREKRSPGKQVKKRTPIKHHSIIAFRTNEKNKQKPTTRDPQAYHIHPHILQVNDPLLS